MEDFASPRIKVAIDARLVSGNATGDSTYWTELLRAMQPQLTDVQLLLLTNADPSAEIPETDRCQWVRVPGRSSRLWSLFAFPFAARRLGADLAHTQYTLSPLVRRGVTTVHDVSFLIGPDWFKPRDRFLLQRTVPDSCRRAARILTVSETSRSEIERLIPAARGKVVATPLGCPTWIQPVPREDARAIVASKLGLSEPYALTVGTSWPRKNLQLALDAMDRLPADVPHVLALTGKSGWGDQALGARGRALGYVDRNLLSALYSGADLYLCPSRHEGFGIPILEAFRCGCPVVASSGGALPEVADDAAEIVLSWSPEAWARRIETLLRDPSKLDFLRERGYRREREFSWEETARRTLDVYRQVAS